MSNEEILQQAKDHAAWKTCGWTSFREAVQQCDPVTLRQIMDEALRIAIQSAREEAKKAIEDFGTLGHDPKNPMWDTLPDSAEAVNAAYTNAWNKFRQLAIKKLTALGR